jgi:glyceraldehyde 3-phosphate dehydrogenase
MEGQAMAVRIAINGFGRIGRCIARIAAADKDVELVHINDITDAKTLAHLLKYDSIHGRAGFDVAAKEKSIVAAGREIEISAEKDPAALPWKAKGIDIVLECTGKFLSREGAGKHLAAGAKKVILSAPPKEKDTLTIVFGINQEAYKPAEHHIVSNASCTTNCLAPLAKVLHENFGIVKALMTTIHSYTNDQRILDLPHDDLRRARAAAMSMIPTTTGAAKAVGLVLPALKGRIDGIAIRVPTPNVSLVDLTAQVSREKIAAAEINAAVKAASEGALKGVIDYVTEPLVSCDFNGNPHPSIFDSNSTMVASDNLVKVFSWYDNEWGFSNQMFKLVKYVGAKA